MTLALAFGLPQLHPPLLTHRHACLDSLPPLVTATRHGFPGSGVHAAGLQVAFAHVLMFFNLVTDIVTVVSLYILLYFIFSIVSMFLHMLHFLINIQQVLKLIELSTIIRYIQQRVKLYPTGKPDCSNKVCKWSLFMFAPAHPARFPSLFGVLSAPASVTPVAHGAVVCCLGSTGALPMPKANSLHVYSNRYYKPK